MSVEVARRYSDAVRARDFATAEQLLDPEVEVVPPSGRVYGLAGLRSGWTGPGFDHLETAVAERSFGEDGDQILERSSQEFRWRETGEVAYVRPLATRYSFRDGRIVRIEIESA